ncbi:hypothetical protein HDU93_001461, partial [Gonapodya sp. JEL0774]
NIEDVSRAAASLMLTQHQLESVKAEMEELAGWEEGGAGWQGEGKGEGEGNEERKWLKGDAEKGDKETQAREELVRAYGFLGVVVEGEFARGRGLV